MGPRLGPRARSATVWVDGLDHPEGVCADPDRGVVHAGGEDGQLVTVDAGGDVIATARPMAGMVLGLTVDAAGDVIACNPGTRSVRLMRDGVASVLLDRVAGRALVTPNYSAFGPDGTLYLTDSGTWAAEDGRVIRLDADGVADVLTDRLPHFPNGCAVTPDGRWLLVAESRGPTVSRIDLRDGGPPELVVRLDGTVPDGLALTTAGGILIACYRPDRIALLDPDGRLEVLAEDPQGTLLAAPTNICFTGPVRDRLVSANLGRWHLTVLEVDLVGVDLHRPVRWAGAPGPGAPADGATA